jgi:hypothetical protein
LHSSLDLSFFGPDADVSSSDASPYDGFVFVFFYRQLEQASRHKKSLPLNPLASAILGMPVVNAQLRSGLQPQTGLSSGI